MFMSREAVFCVDPPKEFSGEIGTFRGLVKDLGIELRRPLNPYELGHLEESLVAWVTLSDNTRSSSVFEGVRRVLTGGEQVEKAINRPRNELLVPGRGVGFKEDGSLEIFDWPNDPRYLDPEICRNKGIIDTLVYDFAGGMLIYDPISNTASGLQAETEGFSEYGLGNMICRVEVTSWRKLGEILKD